MAHYIDKSLTDAEDIADVAALTEDGHVGQLYKLTGPRMLTFEQAIAEIGQAAGRERHFKSVSMEAFVKALTEQENPADIVGLLQYLFREVLDGRNAHLSNGIERALISLGTLRNSHARPHQPEYGETVMFNSIATITFAAAIGSGLIAGIFFAFSTFVMSALARLQPSQGIATMQFINVTVINPWFMTAFLGTAVACLFLAVSALFKWHQPSAIYLLVGSLLYLVGTFGVTMVFNVPLNDALAKVDPNSSEGATLWASYLVNWTAWNHFRMAMGLVAAGALTIALGK